jgi:hypothetical protein
VKTTPTAVLVLAAVVALLGFSGSVPVPAQPAPKAQQYEFKFLVLTHGNPQHDEKSLNDLSADGWVVDAATTQVRGVNANVVSDARLVLKRQKR